MNFSSTERKKLDMIVLDCTKAICPSTFKQDSDSVFLLKSYCLDNLILLNAKQRDYCLKGIAKRMKLAKKKQYEALEKQFVAIAEEMLDRFNINKADLVDIIEDEVGVI